MSVAGDVPDVAGRADEVVGPPDPWGSGAC